MKKKIALVFLRTLSTGRSYSVFLRFEKKANLQSGQPKDYKKCNHSDETTPLKQGRKKWKYDINRKGTPRISLNWIAREQNVRSSTAPFCEEPQTSNPKHEIYMLHFLFDNNCNHMKPIFSQWPLVGEERVTNPKRGCEGDYIQVTSKIDEGFKLLAL